MNTSPLKLIFKGRFEFGNTRTYNLALHHWTTRLEVYFKTDILFKLEDIFNEEDFSMTIPQTVVVSWEKPWVNTTKMVEDIAQFAVVGQVRAWCIDNGKLVESKILEPTSEKLAVSEFIKGRALSEEIGKEKEAAEALANAIEKYERHALAYERRGFMNFRLGNYKDASYDWSKSIDINPNNPESYYGRGKVKMLKNDWEAAAADFGQAISKSIALQPIFYRSRLSKAECLFHLKNYKEAAVELSFFLTRKARPDDPNFKHNRRGWHLYGKTLFELGDLNKAIDAFNMALSIKEGKDNSTEAEGLLQRGICLHKQGKKEYAKDLKAAAEMGSDEAKKLLLEFA